MSHIKSWPQPVQESLQLIGQIIQYARKSAGYTIAQIAQKAGVERKTIARLEKGDPGINLGLLITILWLLDIPLLQAIDIGHRQPRTQLALLLKSLSKNQVQRVSSSSKKHDDDF